MFFRVLPSLVLGLALVCGPAFGQTQPGGPAAAPINPGAPNTLSPEEAATYKLGPGDQLRIITYDETQLTGQFYVDSAGTVSMPLIGAVPASGRTVGEVQADIVRLLKDGYIKNPSISVEVLTFRPYYILGEVNKPGEYPYTADLTVFNAVATAGGFTYRANEGRVFVKHQGAAQEEKLKLAPDTKVLPGDTVRISERFF